MDGWIERGVRKARKRVMCVRRRMKRKGCKRSENVLLGD
jgi:hypothetical protein